MTETRERRLIDAFVEATDTLVADFDIVELLQTLIDNAVTIFDADAAGILLANQQGELEVLVSTSEQSNLLGVLQLEDGEGPCIEAYAHGIMIAATEPSEMERRWPHFAAAAARSGYGSVHSIPLRIRDEALGSMNLFRELPGSLNERDAIAARALTDVATISILQQRTTDHAARAQQQLQQALDSRILIEQAKGFIAQTLDVDLDTAFAVLRGHARSEQRLLSECAAAIVRREVPVPGLDAVSARRADR